MKKKEINLIFTEETKEGFRKTGIMDIEKHVVKLSELSQMFGSFKVDSIELYVEGVVKSGQITNLLISGEGKGGCKITLKSQD